MKKKTLPLLLALALLIALTACSSGGAATMNEFATTASPAMREQSADMLWATGGMVAGSAGDVAPAEAAPAGQGDSAAPPAAMSGEPVVDTGRKLIRTGWYTLETMEYSQTIQQIEELVNTVGGYIQSSSQSGDSAVSSGYSRARYAHYTLRVPAESFFSVGRSLGDIATVTQSEQSAEEVTDYYYDTDARLKTLRIQEERLLALMSQATELEAIITLERSLGEVRYEIESHEGTLRRLDSQIAFSTLSIEVYEVFEPSKLEPVPVTLGQRIETRFKHTLDRLRRGGENLLVVVLGDGLRWLINLCVLGAVAFAAFRVYKAVKKRRAAQPQKPRREESLPKGDDAGPDSPADE